MNQQENDEILFKERLKTRMEEAGRILDAFDDYIFRRGYTSQEEESGIVSSTMLRLLGFISQYLILLGDSEVDAVLEQLLEILQAISDAGNAKGRRAEMSTDLLGYALELRDLRCEGKLTWLKE